MARPTLTDMNLDELNYYPFMISLNKCTGSCNSLFPKLCVPKERKTYFKVFNMITNKGKAKAMAEHVSCDCKCNLNDTTYNSK